MSSGGSDDDFALDVNSKEAIDSVDDTDLFLDEPDDNLLARLSSGPDHLNGGLVQSLTKHVNILMAQSLFLDVTAELSAITSASPRFQWDLGVILPLVDALHVWHVVGRVLLDGTPLEPADSTVLEEGYDRERRTLDVLINRRSCCFFLSGLCSRKNCSAPHSLTGLCSRLFGGGNCLVHTAPVVPRSRRL